MRRPARRSPFFVPIVEPLECRTAPAVWGLDPTFGGAGVVSVTADSMAKYFYDVAVQPDGAVVAVGGSQIASITGFFTVFRFTADGRPDPTFDGDGFKPVPFEGPVAANSSTGQTRPEARAVAILPDGDILAAGNSHVQIGTGPAGAVYDSAVGVVRLNPDGSYDAGFGTNGRVRVGLPASVDGSGNVSQKVSSMAVTPDGHILIGASILQFNGQTGGLVSPVVVRLNADGSRDAGFGTDGVVILPVTQTVRGEFFGGDPAVYRYPDDGETPDLDLAPDGRVVVTDRSRWVNYATVDTPTYFSVARLNADGSLDGTFDKDGIKTVRYQTRAKGGSLYDTGEAVVSPDGRVTVAGIAYPDGSPTEKLQTGFIRLNPDGTADQTVSETGVRLSPNPQHFSGQGAAAGPDGSVYLFGVSYDADPAANPFMISYPLAVRLRADGTLDRRFDRDGDFAAGAPSDTDQVYGGTVAPDGRLLIVGYSFGFDSDGFGNATSSINPFVARAKYLGEVGTVQFSPAAVTVGEADGNAVLTVTRTGGSFGAITVDVTTAGGTATGADFSVASPLTLTWADGDTEPKTIAVPIIRDQLIDEPTETFTVTIASAGYPEDVGPDGTATVSILNDGPGTFRFLAGTAAAAEGGAATLTVVREGGRSSRVSVGYDAPLVIDGPLLGTATPGADFTPLHGTLVWEDGDITPRTVTFETLADDAAEATETAIVTLTATGVTLGDPQDAVVSIVDGPGRLEFDPATYQADEGGEAVVTVRRVGGAGGAATVRYATADGTATAGADYEPAAGELVWNDGDAAPKSFRVQLLGDAVFEGPEAFSIRLSAPTGAAAAAGAAAVEIRDNDPPAVSTVYFSAADFRAVENAGEVVVTVVRGGPTAGPVTVAYTTTAGTAVPDQDYLTAAGQLAWADGEGGPKTFAVRLIDDDTPEPTEAFGVQLLGATGAGLGNTLATVTVTDDRTVPPVIPPGVPPVPPAVPPGVPPVPPVIPGLPPSASLRGWPQTAVGGESGVAFHNADGTVRATNTPFPGFAGGVRTAAADFNGDGVADLVVGTGPGRATRVRVLDGVTQAELFGVDPFEAAFTGGVYVAAGDLNGDGVADLVITPDEGGGPRCDVYSGAGFGKFASFFGIDDPNFRGGARPAVGDMNGDGVGDLVVAAGFGGGPRVAGFDGKSLSGTPTRVFADFFAFEQTLRNGIFVAAGDLNGDGRADLIAGGGPGGGPRVTAFSAGDPGAVIANFFGGGTGGRGGVRVAVKDLDGDARADLVVGSGTGAGSRVTAYLGRTIAPTGTPTAAFDFDAFAGSTAGVFVG